MMSFVNQSNHFAEGLCNQVGTYNCVNGLETDLPDTTPPKMTPYKMMQNDTFGQDFKSISQLRTVLISSTFGKVPPKPDEHHVLHRIFDSRMPTSPLPCQNCLNPSPNEQGAF